VEVDVIISLCPHVEYVVPQVVNYFAVTRILIVCIAI